MLRPSKRGKKWKQAQNFKVGVSSIQPGNDHKQQKGQLHSDEISSNSNNEFITVPGIYLNSRLSNPCIDAHHPVLMSLLNHFKLDQTLTCHFLHKVIYFRTIPRLLSPYGTVLVLLDFFSVSGIFFDLVFWRKRNRAPCVNLIQFTGLSLENLRTYTIMYNLTRRSCLISQKHHEL